MSNYELVRDAIFDRRQVVATYGGHRRYLCPHLLGLNAEGRWQGLFYQFAGGSESGIGPSGSTKNWRCLPLAQMTDVAALDGDWHTAANYSKSPSCLRWVEFAVEMPVEATTAASG